MKLYHGCNMAVEAPRLIQPSRKLDFGAAFYLTSDIEQARKWALRTWKLHGVGAPMVSVYNFDESDLGKLKVITFDSPNLDWLLYVVANRTGKETPAYDLVIGPVANDQTIRTINNYQQGYFTAEIALQLLLPQKLKDQYAFKSMEALALLTFQEVLQ